MKKIVYLAVLLMFVTIMGSCNKRKKADIIVYNANVYTVNNQFPKASAFAVKNGRFIAVGSDNKILSEYVATEKINAGGKSNIPWF